MRTVGLMFDEKSIESVGVRVSDEVDEHFDGADGNLFLFGSPALGHDLLDSKRNYFFHDEYEPSESEDLKEDSFGSIGDFLEYDHEAHKEHYIEDGPCEPVFIVGDNGLLIDQNR